jgi:hypothetical protein
MTQAARPPFSPVAGRHGKPVFLKTSAAENTPFAVKGGGSSSESPTGPDQDLNLLPSPLGFIDEVSN